MSTAIKAGVLGGVIIFIWSVVSWMVLPWHTSTIHALTDEKSVIQTLDANASAPGIYFAPSWSNQQELNSQNAMPARTAFIAIQQVRSMSMLMPMILSLLTQIIAACLVAWMLGKTTGLGYFQRVLFVTVFGLAAGIVTEIPYWNWFGFETSFILVALLDLVISWYFAGLVMAALYRRRHSS